MCMGVWPEAKIRKKSQPKQKHKKQAPGSHHEKTNKKVYQQTLSLKLIKNTLKFEEMMEICEVLGYRIDFIKA